MTGYLPSTIADVQLVLASAYDTAPTRLTFQQALEDLKVKEMAALSSLKRGLETLENLWVTAGDERTKKMFGDLKASIRTALKEVDERLSRSKKALASNTVLTLDSESLTRLLEQNVKENALKVKVIKELSDEIGKIAAEEQASRKKGGVRKPAAAAKAARSGEAAMLAAGEAFSGLSLQPSGVVAAGEPIRHTPSKTGNPFLLPPSTATVVASAPGPSKAAAMMKPAGSSSSLASLVSVGSVASAPTNSISNSNNTNATTTAAASTTATAGLYGLLGAGAATASHSSATTPRRRLLGMGEGGGYNDDGNEDEEEDPYIDELAGTGAGAMPTNQQPQHWPFFSALSYESSSSLPSLQAQDYCYYGGQYYNQAMMMGDDDEGNQSPFVMVEEPQARQPAPTTTSKPPPAVAKASKKNTAAAAAAAKAQVTAAPKMTAFEEAVQEHCWEELALLREKVSKEEGDGEEAEEGADTPSVLQYRQQQEEESLTERSDDDSNDDDEGLDVEAVSAALTRLQGKAKAQGRVVSKDHFVSLLRGQLVPSDAGSALPGFYGASSDEQAALAVATKPGAAKGKGEKAANKRVTTSNIKTKKHHHHSSFPSSFGMSHSELAVSDAMMTAMASSSSSGGSSYWQFGGSGGYYDHYHEYEGGGMDGDDGDDGVGGSGAMPAPPHHYYEHQQNPAMAMGEEEVTATFGQQQQRGGAAAGVGVATSKRSAAAGGTSSSSHGTATSQASSTNNVFSVWTGGSPPYHYHPSAGTASSGDTSASSSSSNGNGGAGVGTRTRGGGVTLRPQKAATPPAVPFPPTSSLPPRSGASSSSSGAAASSAGAGSGSGATFSLEQVGNVQQRRRENLSKEQKNIFIDWFLKHLDNPYPTELEKKQLAAAAGTTVER
jgi:Homeobox KN domain